MPTAPIKSPEAAEFIERVFRAGVNMADVCREARVAESTPSRWKGPDGWEPRPRTLRRLSEALNRLIERKQAEPFAQAEA